MTSGIRMTTKHLSSTPGITRPPRIAVLLTNNDESEFSHQFPNDGEKVCALLRPHRDSWQYDIYSVKDDEFPSAGAADGYIITGSPASVHDALPWIAKLKTLIQCLNEGRFPLIGLCFGHQMIATALGGCVSRNPGGWRFGIAETQYETQESWMEPGTHRMRLHACHSEQVTQLPPGARRLGGDAFCPIASFAIAGHIFTTEYHPEFTHEFMTALADAYQGEVPDDVLEAGRRELHGNVDSEIFARWAVSFLEQNRG
jgi:GMP synthase-like glutamine amidotransferase